MKFIDSLFSYCRSEVSGWKKPEVFWLVFSVSTVIISSVFLGDTLIGVISAATGIAAWVLAGKGKSSAFLIGSLNVVLYAILSYYAGFLGTSMLQLFFCLPINIIGFFLWLKHFDKKTGEVVKRRLTNKMRLIILFIIIPAVYFLGLILQNHGDPLPFIDSITTVLTAAALILTATRFAEQWWLWIVIDVFSILLWCQNILSGGTNYAALLMFAVYLANAIIMAIKWQKSSARGR